MENILSILEAVGKEQEEIKLYHKGLDKYVKFYTITVGGDYLVYSTLGEIRKIKIEKAQEVLFPHETHLSWEGWRKYLFKDGETFITPKSYVFRSSALTRGYNMNECLKIRPFCVKSFDDLLVSDCFENEVKIEDFEDFRFATDTEIISFFEDNDAACDHSIYPKFKPGDVVVLKDYATDKNFPDAYVIGDRKFLDGAWKYKIGYLDQLLSDGVIIDEKYLVRCSIIPETEEKLEEEIQQPDEKKETVIVESDDDDLL